jgi:parallel beta-helix repeat protein
MKLNVAFLFFVFTGLMFGQPATSFDCFSVYTFKGATAQAGQDNSSAAAPCVAWRVTYTSSGFSSVTVKFQTSPDNSSWSDVTNSICSSSVQPPCVTDGANPLASGVMGSASFRAYGKFVRVSVTSVTGTGSGQVVTYGYKGTSASASTGSGGSVTNPLNWVRPESFGAIGDCVHNDTSAIQSALDSTGSATNDPAGAGTVALTGGKCYLVNAAVNINNSFETLLCDGLGLSQCTIKSSSTTADIVKFNGGGTGNCAAGGVFRSSLIGIFLTRSNPATTGSGVSIVKACVSTVRDVESYDSINGFYIQLSGQTLLERNIAYWTSTSSNDRRGVFVDSSSGGKNESVRLKTIIVPANGTKQTGLLVSGDCIADTFVDDFETAGTDYGIVVTSTAATNGTPNYCNGDVHITNPIIDLSTVAGIQVNNVIGGNYPFVGITGGSVNIAASNGIAIDIENSRGVTAVGMSLRSTAGTAILLNGGSALVNTIMGNKIDDSLIGISLVGAPYNSIIGNIIDSNPASALVSLATGATNNLISQNLLIGSATNSILLASGANNNIAYPNNIVGAPISDSGTGNLTAGAAASGSACAITQIIQGIVTAATCTP